MGMFSYDNIKKWKALWIWPSINGDEINQYVQFRHEFCLDRPLNEGSAEEAELYISVDTDYAVWINGNFVNCNQFDDFPGNKAFDVLPVGSLLKQGKNVLCILAYHQGENSFQYIKGEPGLLYSIRFGEIFVSSGENTMCRVCGAYKNGPVPKVTGQLGFTFEYDANMDDSWLKDGYIPGSEWHRASAAKWSNKNRTTLYKRPVKKLIIKDRAAAEIITQGVFRRVRDKAGTVAQMMQTDFLSARLPKEILSCTRSFDCDGKYMLPCMTGFSLNEACFEDNQGVYLVLDLNREEAGIFDIEIESDSGAVIDIAYGEHLYDLRVTARAEDRNFADRCICKEGRQRFTHYFTRFGCRYIQLHISNVKKRFILYYAGLLPVEYPVDFRGVFSCSDLLHSKIYSVAVRTLHLCMHEHYEDTPMREQALYSMDSRNQALCGYYCFGEYDYPQAAISLLGESLKSDGYLEMCAPAQPKRTIPSFSMIWFIELYEFYLYSGRIDFVKKMLPVVKAMLGKYMENLVDFLLPTPQGDRYWNFYEWADGLDNFSSPIEQGIKLDAPLNLFFYMALDASEKLFEACNEAEDAIACSGLKNKMRKAIHDTFWNEKEKAYATSVCNGVRSTHFAELTQALALYANVCPEDAAQGLRARLASNENGFVPITLSYSIFKYEALLQDYEKYGKRVFDEIAELWSSMLYRNATSFWEVINAPDLFRQGWSLCHGWSAIPVYLYHAYILGVKPVKPGFMEFYAKPVCSNIDRAWGCVPTPEGLIQIKKVGTDKNISSDVKYPDTMKLV